MKTYMERIEQIRRHPIYREAMEQIEHAEKDRIYCRHNREHLLDVARIMYIRKLEQGLDVSKEMIYATALLHDIGRAKQYTEGIPHDEAGAVMAGQILQDSRFAVSEIEEIVLAIGDHRNKDGSAGEETCLAKLLKEADNLSRACYSCEAEETCKWSTDRKNLGITI